MKVFAQLDQEPVLGCSQLMFYSSVAVTLVCSYVTYSLFGLIAVYGLELLMASIMMSAVTVLGVGACFVYWPGLKAMAPARQYRQETLAINR